MTMRVQWSKMLLKHSSFRHKSASIYTVATMNEKLMGMALHGQVYIQSWKSE